MGRLGGAEEEEEEAVERRRRRRGRRRRRDEVLEAEVKVGSAGQGKGGSDKGVEKQKKTGGVSL